jgi:Bacterial Ig domain
MPRRPIEPKRLTVESLEARETPSAGPWTSQSFDGGNSTLPMDWARWPTAATVKLEPGLGVDSTTALIVNGGAIALRAWEKAILPPDSAVAAKFLAEGAGPLQLILRGHALDTSRPAFYGASVGSGGTVQISRTIGGITTILASVKAATWPTGRWLDVSFQPTGTQLAVVVRQMQSDQWLNGAGQWTSGATAALTVTDETIFGAGQVGISRPASRSGRLRIDDFTVRLPNASAESSFDGQPLGTQPPGWTSWNSSNESAIRIGGVGTFGNGLTSAGGSANVARIWMDEPFPSDVTVTAAILADSLIPAQVIARGRNLDGLQPTYYAASVIRGTEVTLIRVVDGAVSELATLQSATYLSGTWLDVSLTTQGDHIQARVRRRDTGEWLNRFGLWQPQAAAAIDVIDSAIRGIGFCGVGRAASYSGTINFDDFRITAASGDVTSPSLSVRSPLRRPAVGKIVDGSMRFVAIAVDSGGIDRVDFLVDGELIGRRPSAPYQLEVDSRNLSNGKHVLFARAWDLAGNVAVKEKAFVVDNPPVVRPAIPVHYPHIRVAALAYDGNPMSATEAELLRRSVDLVVPNSRYLGAINTVAPATPQLIYANFSNLYQDPLTDWLTYAEQHGFDREAAFYHVTEPTSFTGDSPSSQAVSWFWNVAKTSVTGSVDGYTTAAHLGDDAGIVFGEAGSAIIVGYPDRFREINLRTLRDGSAAWSAQLDCPTAVDANGQPTAWKALSIVADSTNGLRGSGQVAFDPPLDWLPAVVAGSSARLFYVRMRTATGTVANAPIAATILGRDFVNAGGRASGTIPAFDARADGDHDGYLSDAEFARRRPGFDARFFYESRLFYPNYGQMRFTTNPSGRGVVEWSVGRAQQRLKSNPLTDGLFADNSNGRPPTNRAVLRESTDTYASDFGSLLGAINRAIAPRWLFANTAGGGTDADRVVRQVPGTIEEFALRPLAHTWTQFQDLASTVSRRLALANPAGYLILDSLSNGGSPTDARTRMAALAEYYLLADPQATMFMAWGGEEPASSWARHWWDAIAFDVGKPLGGMSEFAAGPDPSNGALTYRVFQRHYGNALVLYKPLAYAAGNGAGTTADSSATVHQLSGDYRLLNADGTLGPITTQVRLRNGEGAVLVPV